MRKCKTKVKIFRYLGSLVFEGFCDKEIRSRIVSSIFMDGKKATGKINLDLKKTNYQMFGLQCGFVCRTVVDNVCADMEMWMWLMVMEEKKWKRSAG